MAVLQ